MKEKLESLLMYLAARAKEPQTWQGVAFFLGAGASHYAFLMNPGECALIGSIVSGMLKVILPDVKPPE